MTRIAVFASGTGSNTAKIIDYFKHHETICVALIVTNRKAAGVVSISVDANIPVLVLEKEKFFSGDAYLDVLKQNRIDFIVLAGFLWKIPPNLISAFPGSMVNIHPALLPKFGGPGMFGAKVHEAVIRSGDTSSGISIHYVDEHYDNGDVIFQAECEVDPNETPESLAEKIHALEYAHFPRVIDQVIAMQNQQER